MSDYIKTTDFLAKDSLAVGDANKIIKGSEFEVEFDAIAVAIATKAEPATALAAALAAAYPIGSVYINVTSTNPATLFGFGTWSAFGAGRVLVGLDAGNAAFDTAEETGGSADAVVVSHSHTAAADPAGSHSHTATTYGNSGGGNLNLFGIAINTSSTGTATTNSVPDHSHPVTVDPTGSSGTNANLQPYIVVYMWKRTA